MIFWKEDLAKLSASDQSYCDIYSIMKARFSDEIFAKEYKDGFMESTTYKELFEGVETVAHNLCRLFPDEYNRFVGIRMDNSPLWVMCFWGALMAGFRPLLINTRLDEESIAYAVKVTDAVCVLADEDKEIDGYVNANNFKPSFFVPAKWADEIVLMSSGTTGTPKLVLYDGKSICRQILVSGWVVKENPAIKHNKKLDIRLVALLPFYHIFGLSTTLMWFGFFGRTMIFPPSADSKGIQFACKAGEATHFFSIPLVWESAVKSLISEAKRQGKEEKLRKAVKFSNALQTCFPRFGAYVARNILFKDVRSKVFGNSLGFCISGGGFISDETVEIMNGIGYSMYVGYGMTETGITSVDLSRKAKLRNQNTVGKPFPIIEYKINSDGELLVKGDTLCRGFVTEDGVKLRKKDEFFATGDACRVDAQGRWILCGRSDDIITGANGENVSPDMVERMLNIRFSNPLCVLGIEIERDMRAVAVVSVNSNISDYEKVCISREIYTAMDSVPVTFRPYKVYLTTDELPSNLGKIKRSLLRKMIASGEVTLCELARPDSENLDEIYNESVMAALDTIKECFAQVLSIDAADVSDNSHFIYDLGGDSMSYFNLVSLISEKYSKELRVQKDVALFTPLDFAREVLNTD